MLKSIFVSDDSLKLFLLEFSIIFLEIIGLLILIVRQICKLVVLFISVPVHTKDSSMKKILASVIMTLTVKHSCVLFIGCQLSVLTPSQTSFLCLRIQIRAGRGDTCL